MSVTDSQSGVSAIPGDAEAASVGQGPIFDSQLDIDLDSMKYSVSPAVAGLDAALAYIESTLKAGGEVSIPPLGKFKTSERKARDGRNPATGETIKIAASRAPKFQPAKALKDALNK